MPKRWYLLLLAGVLLNVEPARAESTLNLAWQAPGTAHANGAALITSFGAAQRWGIGIGVSNHRGDALTDTALYGLWRPRSRSLLSGRAGDRISPFLGCGIGATMDGTLQAHPLVGGSVLLSGRWSLFGVYKRRVDWFHFGGRPQQANILQLGIGCTFGR